MEWQGNIGTKIFFSKHLFWAYNFRVYVWALIPPRGYIRSRRGFLFEFSIDKLEILRKQFFDLGLYFKNFWLKKCRNVKKFYFLEFNGLNLAGSSPIAPILLFCSSKLTTLRKHFFDLGLYFKNFWLKTHKMPKNAFF